MATSVHLARHGSKGRPIYRIVASRKGAKRDGRFIEIIGTYDPRFSPARIILKEEKIQKWINYGAQFSETTRNLVNKTFPGLITKHEERQRAKIQAHRRKRKERAKAAGRTTQKKSARSK